MEHAINDALGKTKCLTILDDLKESDAIEIRLTGSQYTCSPTPVNSDTDYLVYVRSPDDMSGVVESLRTAGYYFEGAEHYHDAGNCTFTSWRCPANINVILTSDKDFNQRHEAATELCKKLNLLDKNDRILVFQTILYNNHMWLPDTKK